MRLTAAVEQILKNPTPEGLWAFQPTLLALDHPSAEATRDIVGQFFIYLSAVRSKAESRNFPVLATVLAAGSSALDVAESLLNDEHIRLLPLLLDGLHLTLAALSNYQFVLQWEPDFAAVHDAAVWNLYAAYWKLSADFQPDMEFEKRQQLLDSLFEVVRDANADSRLRLALLVRLFTWGLVTRLIPLIALEHQS
jgi:hypothetical protein